MNLNTLEVGVDISTKNNRHNEIQLKINNANKAYFAMNKMLNSRLLSKSMKEKLFTSFLRPILLLEILVDSSLES